MHEKGRDLQILQFRFRIVQLCSMFSARWMAVVFLFTSRLLWSQASTPSVPQASGDVASAGIAASGSAVLPDSTKLESVDRVPLIYPDQAKAAKLQGTTVVKVSITETGDVDGTEVISGEPILAAACETSLKKWKFKPFIRNGKPVRVSTKLTCDFKPPDDSPPIVPIEDRSSKSNQPTESIPAVGADKAASVYASSSETAHPPDSTALVIIKKVKASYPLEAEQGEIQGEAVVKIVVNENGDVGECTALSGNPVLTRAVADVVKKWKFEPYLKDGKPIKAAAILTWDFAFKDRIIVNKPFDPTKEVPSGSTPAAPQRVRVSSGVTAGLLVYKVAPVYPYSAKMAHIQGTVVLAAVIGKDGRIKKLEAVSGPRELIDSSIGAVQQWRYRPYILLGNPVEVDTQITVNYTLHWR